MTQKEMKERLLAIGTYEEFDSRRDEFKGMKPDREIIDHLCKITPKTGPYTEEELYFTPPSKGGTIGR